MTKFERQMYDVVSDLRDTAGVLALKAEFEAEGTRVDELLRLLDVAKKAGLEIALKIGGCEAIRDLIESKSFGCQHIIAPMVETPYALSKFTDAVDRIYPGNQRQEVKCLFNIETKTAAQNLEELLDIAEGKLDGAVFGRVDYVGSMGLSRDSVCSDQVLNTVMKVAKGCKQRGLELVVGGGVSGESIPFLRHVHEICLDRFETRKVIFSGSALSNAENLKKSLVKAVEFEILWLKNKRAFYQSIYMEDEQRIEMLEKRWGAFGDK